ncbi:MAG: PKD domain-containing protein [Bacteroidota bacterium]
MLNSNYRKPIALGSYSLLIMILSIFIVSCDDDDEETIVIPVANFDSEINFLEVAFTDASNDAETYRWDFGIEGDEDISTDASPSFSYSEAGTYTVTLIVANSTGGSDVQQEDITVRAAVLPTANFTFESATGLDINFTDGSENADSYLWDFGIEGVDTDTSTVASPTFTFPSEGDFDVSLTVTSTDGFTDTETKTITVSRVAVVPMAEFSFAATDLSVTFTDASSNAASYLWDFGVEGIDTDISTEASPSFTYPTFGTYEVSLTVTSTTGDTDEETMSVTVSLPAPVADFTFVASDLAVTFTNTSTNAETYSWDFGDGSSANTEESPMYTYATGGEFTVTLTATTADGQTDTQIMQVEVIDPTANDPVAGFSFVTNLLEVTFTDQSLNAVSHMWDFGDGNNSMMANPVHTYASAGTYTVSLTITNSEAVMDTETMMVEVTDGAATFAAELQNADFESYPTGEMNNNDLVDAWTIDPDNTFNDGSDTPFDFWRNDDLESWVSNSANTGGSTDKASSSGTDATSAGGSSGRSLKFDSPGERAYQPFEVEQGIEYTISAFVKSETTAMGDVEGTFYILRDEPADETNLASFAITTVPVSSLGPDTWQQVTFSFTVDGTFSFPQSRVDENAADILTSEDQNFVIFYFAPTSTVNSSNEVFLTDVVITTPGF